MFKIKKNYYYIYLYKEKRKFVVKFQSKLKWETAAEWTGGPAACYIVVRPQVRFWLE